MIGGFFSCRYTEESSLTPDKKGVKNLTINGNDTSYVDRA
jgi:acyl CoA:acetate/3-ketoacid CoA transferase alpha subunit